MTVGWKPQILSEIGDREEIRISSERTGGGYNRWTPVWVVRVGDDLYVRSGFGKNGFWYRHATGSQAYVDAEGVQYKVSLILDRDSLDRCCRRGLPAKILSGSVTAPIAFRPGAFNDVAVDPANVTSIGANPAAQQLALGRRRRR